MLPASGSIFTFSSFQERVFFPSRLTCQPKNQPGSRNSTGQRVSHHPQGESSGSGTTLLQGCPGKGSASGAAALACVKSSQRLFSCSPPPQLGGEAPETAPFQTRAEKQW